MIKAPTPSHRSNLLVVPCLGLGSGWLVSGDWWEGKVGAGAGAGAANKGRGLVVVCNNWDTGNKRERERGSGVYSVKAAMGLVLLSFHLLLLILSPSSVALLLVLLPWQVLLALASSWRQGMGTNTSQQGGDVG